MAGTIYGSTFATCTQRVFVVAYELGVPLKLSVVDILKGDQKHPSHLARHPFGKVPAYESEDGVKLFESRAIARYLDAATGGKLTRRDNLKENARFETWASVEVANFDGHAAGLAKELVFKVWQGVPTIPAEVEKHKQNLGATLDVYEKELAGRKYLAGDHLTLADLFHLPNGSHAFRVVPELLATRPNVKRWFQSLEALPSWQQTLSLTKN